MLNFEFGKIDTLVNGDTSTQLVKNDKITILA